MFPCDMTLMTAFTDAQVNAHDTWSRMLYTWNRLLYTWIRLLYTWNRLLYTWNRLLYTWNRLLYTWHIASRPLLYCTS